MKNFLLISLVSLIFVSCSTEQATEYPEGYDVSAYNFYDMLDILNEEEGTEMPTIMKVFDNAYDAIMYRDDLHCKEEAEALIQCE